MEDPERGKPLLAKARAVALKHGWTPPRMAPKKAVPAKPVQPMPSASEQAVPETTATPMEPASPQDDAPKKKKWWQVF